MVSHQMHTLQSASRCLYLNQGRAVAYGQPRDVIDRYMRDQADAMRRGESEEGEGITRVELLDAGGGAVHETQPGAPVKFRIHYNLGTPVTAPVVTLELVHDDPRFLISTPGANLAQLSSGEALANDNVEGEGVVEVEVDGLHLPVGAYNVRAALKPRGALAASIRNDSALRFEVTRPPESESQALLELAQKWSAPKAASTKVDA